MRSPNEVKPFILHPELVVRNFAVAYFQESFSRDPEIMPLVLQLCEPQPDAENLHLLLHSAHDFVQTPETLAKCFQLYQTSVFNKPKYEKIILHTDPGLLRDFPDELARLPEPLQTKIEGYIRMSLMDTAELWREFNDFGDANAGKYINEFDFHHGVFMARELAKRNDFPKNQAFDLLHADYAEDYDGYLDIYATVLAGELRLEEAIPALLENIRKEGDVLSEEAEAALTKIGTEAVIRRIRESFAEESWCFRLYTGNIFGNIKLPGCEEIILELMRKEKDPSIRWILARGLCRLISRKGIPAVRTQIDDGYDRQFIDLKEELYCSCIIGGVTLPEMQEWREELAMAALLGTRKILDDPFIRDEFGDDEDDFDDWDDEEEDWDEEDDWDEEEDDESETEVKQIVSDKIGRNEPCPCGSGKKYKKCCLGK